jgi:hypothetical protein
MSITVEARPYRSPQGEQYDPDMPKTKPMGVEELRKVLGKELAASAKSEIHIIVRKHGEAIGVFVPLSWYRTAREATGEPTDL